MTGDAHMPDNPTDDVAAKAETRTAWLFLTPFLALFGLFFAYAALRSTWFSLTNYDLFTAPMFVGIRNYINILSEPLFLLALRNSVAFALIVTTVQTALALLLAVYVNRIVRARDAVRTVFYFPSIVSSTVMTLIFLWLFQRQGLVTDTVNWAGNNAAGIAVFVAVLLIVQVALVWNARRTYFDVRAADPFFLAIAVLVALVVTVVLRLGQVLPAGTDAEPISWLNTKDTLLFMPWTLWSIAVMNIFTTVPVMMLLYLAGLQSIPKILYEAAEIDGASGWQQFTKITVPLLAPVTFAIVTLGLVGTLQMFDQVAIIGRAAPIESRITLAYYTYYNTFPPGGSPNIGLASAAAVILAMLSMALVYLQKRFGISDKEA
jgi:multiple sugar transport system permease protein